MTCSVHVFDGFNKLSKHKTTLASYSRQAIEDCKKALNADAIDVAIYFHPTFYVKGMGLTGYAAGPHLIQISINPEEKRFSKNLRRNLSLCIAHEWHHCCRHRSVGYGRTLGEAIVSEGLADRFADQVYGGPPNPWTKAVKKKDVARLYNRAKKEFGKRGYDHNKWFFSNGKRSIPHWTGYSLGYQIVGQFL